MNNAYSNTRIVLLNARGIQTNTNEVHIAYRRMDAINLTAMELIYSMITWVDGFFNIKNGGNLKTIVVALHIYKDTLLRTD
jgi:hypothetical protein